MNDSYHCTTHLTILEYLILHGYGSECNIASSCFKSGVFYISELQIASFGFKSGVFYISQNVRSLYLVLIVMFFYISERQIASSGDRSLPTCCICYKVFRYPAEVTRHMRIHTGEKPFECSECGQRFNQKGGLKAHKISRHGMTIPM